LRNLLTIDSSTRIIVLTGHGSVTTGVKCLGLGAASFLEKPPEIEHLRALVLDGANQAKLKRAYLTLKRSDHLGIEGELIGSSSAIQNLREQILYAAQTNQSIFIAGETGSGKSFCANLIHKYSKRSGSNFVRYQPNYANADLTNSDLFGHVKGAFTGANENRTGLISEAEAGTLFLDEIDELPLETQITLLGVLQERKFRALGSTHEEIADFRLLCASNQDIQKSIKDRKIRSDFYHRVAHSIINVAPLRERSEDLEALALSILAKLRDREQLRVYSLDLEATNKLTSYAWPGNIRELEAVIEGACYRAHFSDRTFISSTDLQIHGSEQNSATNLPFHEQVENYKLQLIKQALNKHNQNQVYAARELMMERSTLRRILAREGE
jgi:DNA-binding NtrC family response regulator